MSSLRENKWRNTPFGLATTNFFRGINSLLPSLKLKKHPKDGWLEDYIVSFWLNRPIFRGRFRGKCSFRGRVIYFFCGENYHCKLAGWDFSWDSLDDEGLKCQMGRYDGEVGDVIGVCFFLKEIICLLELGSHLKWFAYFGLWNMTSLLNRSLDDSLLLLQFYNLSSSSRWWFQIF